jgi:hypothetical protein
MLSRNSIQPLERWIDQFQFSGRRSMSLDEREFLASKLLAASQPINCIAIGLGAFSCAALFALCALGTIDSEFFGPLLTAAIVLTAIIPFQWIHQLRTYRENLADIQVGEVEIFRSSPLSGEESSIVFLPRSGRLLARDGKFVGGRIYLRVNGIARRPRNQPIPFPIQFTLEENHLAPVRLLSRAERNELAALLPKAYQWKWLFPAILWSWSVIGIAYSIKLGMAYPIVARTALLIVAAICLTAYYSYRYRRFISVKNDIRRGTVICEQMGSYKFEHLANSELVWTVDSSPASWRKRSVASWICPSI